MEMKVALSSVYVEFLQIAFRCLYHAGIIHLSLTKSYQVLLSLRQKNRNFFSCLAQNIVANAKGIKEMSKEKDEIMLLLILNLN